MRGTRVSGFGRGRLVAAFIVAGMLAGACGSAAPSAIAPTFEAWSAIGLSCGGPSKGDEPTTLLQWQCQGTVAGAALTVVMDGDDHGILNFVAQVRASESDPVAMAAFRALVAASPYLSEWQARIDTWLLGLPRLGDDVTRIGPQYVHVARDPIWVTLAVASAR